MFCKGEREKNNDYHNCKVQLTLVLYRSIHRSDIMPRKYYFVTENRIHWLLRNSADNVN